MIEIVTTFFMATIIFMLFMLTDMMININPEDEYNHKRRNKK